MTEIWKDIPGYEGHYQVSNLGNVKRLERKDSLGRKLKDKLLKPRANPNGYHYALLSLNGSTHNKSVHRLVAIAFIPNHEDLPVVNHIDENKQNNNVDNLEWCNYKYNANHGTGKERMINKVKILLGRSVTNGETVFDTIGDASRSLNIPRSSISDCVRGLLKTAGGFKWRYVNE
ncbi:HNH endonuclease [Lactococcus phage LW4]|uniref:HNH endonuclease n=6 Tax=Teubervirus TaxID=2843466 RepID=A0A1W6JIA4_9CAUD|nr:HNH endonuclease [Lactococcus phage LW31]YP_009900452.1 HNH endonuclease [Lactococcus phage AM6]ARM65689.1 HNH endonuclease [Lactococcus phage LW32]ARM65777.1 HNH endonuclease [Lactococcus phage LW33]ARM65862.1 HNH endonuclease [Lactococcus phage LW4]ARM66039.1 HNH endonuclease [Lactococcus phage AM7]ARM65604.1 HNH endonuclease [Lactococcus phage LW31]